MRQPAEDRALYYRQLRETVGNVFLPELTSPTAIDAAALVDRILAEFIVEEEDGPELSATFGAVFAELLGADVAPVVSPERFHELRRLAADVLAESAASTDAAVQARNQALAEAERRFLDEVDARRRAVLDTGAAGLEDLGPSLTDSSVRPNQLSVYLRRRLPDSPDVTVNALQVVPGGRSKETILVTLEGTTELPHEVIVRKDRPVGLLSTKAADEFEILKAVYDHGGVPVPQPFFADEEPAGLGEGSLLVMAKVQGKKAGEYFPDLAAPPEEHRPALGRQLAVALAHLHALPIERLADTPLGDGEPVTSESLTAAIEGMAARMGELTGPPIAAVPLVRRWLLDHVDAVTPSGRLCVLQGDVGLHNMLVDGARLTALVDWEAAAIGPPARELAAAYPAATALVSWDEFVRVYVDSGGPPDATERGAVHFYRLFFSLGVCMTSRTGGHLFRTGTKRDLLTAHSGLDAHFRSQRNLARALGDALAFEA